MKKILLYCLVLCSSALWAQSGGSLDTATFNSPIPGLNATCPDVSGDVSCIVNQGNQYLVGGNISLNSCTPKSLIRINANGTVDNTLNTGTGFQHINYTNNNFTINGSIQTIIYDAQAQKIYVGGHFNRYNGVITFNNGIALRNIVRLNLDGSLDQSFTPTINYDITVSKMLKQPDGKILFCGNATNSSSKIIWRLLADGSEDVTFNNLVPKSTEIESLPRGNGFDIAIQPSTGKILIGGDFIITSPQSGNQNTPFTVVNKGLVRLNTDGTLDTGFAKPFMHNQYQFFMNVYQLHLTQDEFIVIIGTFDNCFGTARNNYAKLKPNGELDINYYNDTSISVGVLASKMQSNEKVLFNSYESDKDGYRVRRFNTDGTLDTCFDSNFTTDPGIHYITTIALQNDESTILVGGRRFKVGQGLNTRYSIAKLKNNAIMDAIDDNYTTNTGTGTTLASVFTNDLYNGTAVNPANIFASQTSPAIPGITFNNMTGQITVASTVLPGSYLVRYRICSNSLSCQACDEAVAVIIVTSPVTLVANPDDFSTSCLNTTNGGTTASILDNDTMGSTPVNSNQVTITIDSNGGLNGIIANANGTLSVPANTPIGIYLVNYTIRDNTNAYNVASSTVTICITIGYNPGKGANNNVYAIALQADGKILIGGDFTRYDSRSRARIARLNPDLSLDETFDFNGVGFNNTVRSIAIDSNGKIFVAGDFTATSNGIPVTNLARLQNTTTAATNGTVDTSFINNNFTTLPSPLENDNNPRIMSLSIDSANNLYVGGRFHKIGNTLQMLYAKLSNAGNLLTNFNSVINEDGTINDIKLKDNNVVIAGSFVTNNYYNLSRLLLNGTIDPTFTQSTVSGTDASIYSFDFNENKIVVGGNFNTYNGTARSNIAQINPDGSLDTTFDPGTGTDAPIKSVATVNNGIIIVGEFVDFNEIVRNRIAKLNFNGSLNLSFTPQAGANDHISKTLVQPDGKILIGGRFTTYNNALAIRLARISSTNAGVLSKQENPLPTVITAVKETTEINLFPNPTNGLLNISLGDFSKETFQINIYNTLGQLIKQQETQSNDASQIDLSTLENGSYIIILSNENRTIKKMVIKK